MIASNWKQLGVFHLGGSMLLAKEDSDIEKRLCAVEKAMYDNRIYITSSGRMIVEDVSTKKDYRIVDCGSSHEVCTRLPRCFDTERLALVVTEGH